MCLFDFVTSHNNWSFKLSNLLNERCPSLLCHTRTDTLLTSALEMEFKTLISRTYRSYTRSSLLVIFLGLTSWIMKSSWKKLNVSHDPTFKALTNNRLNLNCGTNKALHNTSVGLELKSPHNLTLICVWLDKVTLEPSMIPMFINESAIEHTCLVATKSTIQISLEENTRLT